MPGYSVMRREIEELTRLVSSLMETADVDASGEPITQIRLEEFRACLSDLVASDEELSRKTEDLFAVCSELEAERDYYRQIFSHSPDAQAITDARGVIRQSNHACAKLLQVH